MSCKGERLRALDRVERFEWTLPVFDEHDADAEAEPTVDIAAIEREAFARGFTEGERAGTATAVTSTELMRLRLVKAVDDVTAVREAMLHKAEQQVVRLALAIASRILHEEIAANRERLLVMAKAAIERMGDRVSATVYLNPRDHEALVRPATTDNGVTLVADPGIETGGCRIESDHGSIDLDVDGQVEEIAKALLSADQASRP